METTLIHVKMIRNFQVDSGFFHHKVILSLKIEDKGMKKS